MKTLFAVLALAAVLGFSTPPVLADCGHCGGDEKEHTHEAGKAVEKAKCDDCGKAGADCKCDKKEGGCDCEKGKAEGGCSDDKGEKTE